MQITLEVYQIVNLVHTAADRGAASAIKVLNPKADEISQRDAFEEFGAACIRKWVREGVVRSRRRKGVSKNSTLIYSRAELQGIYEAEKLQAIITGK